MNSSQGTICGSKAKLNCSQYSQSHIQPSYIIYCILICILMVRMLSLKLNYGVKSAVITGVVALVRLLLLGLVITYEPLPRGDQSKSSMPGIAQLDPCWPRLTQS